MDLIKIIWNYFIFRYTRIRHAIYPYSEKTIIPVVVQDEKGYHDFHVHVLHDYSTKDLTKDCMKQWKFKTGRYLYRFRPLIEKGEWVDPWKAA